ncbi:MAG: hypothetical protein AAF449_00530, partial [Myxococcota bacterium]
MSLLALMILLEGCRGTILDPATEPTSEQPTTPGTPGTPGTPPSPEQPTTKIVDTLATSCTASDNAMPDFRRLSNQAYVEAVAELTGFRMPRDMVLSGLPAQPRDKTITNVDYGLRVGRVYTSRVIDLRWRSHRCSSR